MLNFVDRHYYNLSPNFNLNFIQIEELLSFANNLFDNQYTKNNVNLKFAMFVIYKRIFLYKVYFCNLKFDFNYSDILKINTVNSIGLESFKNLNEYLCSISITNNKNFVPMYLTSINIKYNKSKNIDSNNSSSLSYDKLFILMNIEHIISKFKLIEKICLISIDMFHNKIDSESMEITNFFSYLISLSFFYNNYTLKQNILKIFKDKDFDIESYIKDEQSYSIFKNRESLVAEQLNVNSLSNITEGFVSSFYITAGVKKEYTFYIPQNSLFHLSSTIDYYDGLINIYKYIPLKDNRSNKLNPEDTFYWILKEQKIESDFTPFEINIFTYKPEIYKVVFDNSFSWMNGKEYKFKSCILQYNNYIDSSFKHKLDLKFKIDSFKENFLHKITEYVFFKFETFIGKEGIEKFGKKEFVFNYLNNKIIHDINNILIESLNDNNKNQHSINKSISAFEEIDALVKDKSKSLLNKVVNKEDKIDSNVEMNENKNKIESLNNDDINNNDQIDLLINRKMFSSKLVNSSIKGKKMFKVAKLASLDVILKNYIKNIFVRVNLTDKELEDNDFIKELQRFEDESDSYIILNYYYLRQNKSLSLGDEFEKETLINSNIIFFKYPLVESLLIYYLFENYIEDEIKLDKSLRIIYFHFDNIIDKFNYAFYNEGDVIGDDKVFGDIGVYSDSDNELLNNFVVQFDEIIVKIIDSIDFNTGIIKMKQERNKLLSSVKSKNKNKIKESDNSDNDDSEDESLSDDENEEEEEETQNKSRLLNNWRIVCSFSGEKEFISKSKTLIKEKIKVINNKYYEEKKTTKLKKIKTVFKNLEFIENMTNFMHCFELQ